MKFLTRITSVLLVVLISAAALAGCGKKGNKIADPVADKDGNITLLIGGIGALTGDYAVYGEAVRNGAQLAVDEINAAGGVNGLKLALDFQDSQGKPEAAVSAYGNLVDKGMVISLGGVMSGETASIVAEAKDDGIFILTPSGSAKACIEGNDNAFRLCFNDPRQGTISADYIADNELAKKVAVFYQSDLDYSVGLYETFKAECNKRGIEIVCEKSFTYSNKTDFSTQINAIKEADADLVFIPLYADAAATFLTQAKAADLSKVFFGCDGIDGILTKISDKTIVEGLMMLTPFASDSKEPDVVAFVGKYKEKYNADPNQFAADGYDAIYVIKAAIEKAGFSKDNTKDFQKGLVAAMTQIEVDGVTGTMKWTADGENNKGAMALVFRDGVAVAFEKK